ncbi:MAG: recombinase family protein [Aquabacterium sp.]|uniref:recombinase family protein n=1 Tax=Aquabacterium sp. TaxID=1872578 RepID=UPI0025C066DB|nr:recombinase family protein [Aquabacterium sp.]MBI5926478.1 recombinase family protein [Aquabacterium sp.]
MTSKTPSTSPAPQQTKGQRVGYLRVSTLDQSTARQLEGLELDEVFEDKVSGATVERPQLQAALKHCRKGDTLVVHSMDRLARNLGDLKAIIDSLTKRGASVEFIKERQTFRPEQDDPMATLMLHLLGAVAQFERDMIRERQREGIELAKAKGVYKGRAPKLTTEQAQELRAKDKAANGKGRTALAEAYGISRETLYQYLNAPREA